MFTLRYAFDSHCFFSSLLAQNLAPALAAHCLLKLETTAQPSAVLQSPEMYRFFSQPLLQSDFYLHVGPNFAPDPCSINLWWGQPSAVSVQLERADQLLSQTNSALPQLQKACPTFSSSYLPVCLEIHDWQSPVPPPADLELEPQQRMLLWQAAPQATDSAIATDLSALLQSFIPLSTNYPDAVLVLQLNQVTPDFEDHLLSEIEHICQVHAISDPESLNIHTLIGPLEAEGQKGLLQRSDLLVLPYHPLQALLGRALGKTVLSPAEHVEAEWGCLLWQSSATINSTVLQAGLNQAKTALDSSSLEKYSPAQVAQSLSEKLADLYAEIDLPSRRAQDKAERQQRKAASRRGRKQKYSLFHSDYQSDELKARRAWHERYAAYFMDAPGEVIDIGSGSGIFLEILRDAQVPAFGIDPDPDMVAVCQELGLQALTGDERLLADCAENSLGGIHASHIIEHIDGSRAIAMIENALNALRPGGLLVIRTPNWRNATVRQEGFWLDITHVRPYPLPLLEQVLKDAGFEIRAGGFEEFGWNDTFIVGQKPLPHEQTQGE